MSSGDDSYTGLHNIKISISVYRILDETKEASWFKPSLSYLKVFGRQLPFPLFRTQPDTVHPNPPLCKHIECTEEPQGRKDAVRNNYTTAGPVW